MGQGETWTEAQRQSRLDAQRKRRQHTVYPYEDREWMRAAYVDRDLSFRRMAVEAGCSLRTIARWMQIHEIPADPTKGLRRPDKGTRLGPDWHSWRGDDIGYSAVHLRVRAAKGAASDHACAHCGVAAEQWAYDNADPQQRTHVTNRGFALLYSVDVERYFPLCVSCHARFDFAAKVARNAGDELAGEAAAG